MAVERRGRWRVGLVVQLDLLLVAVVLAMGAAIGAFFVRAEADAMQAELDARIRVFGRYLAAAAEETFAREEDSDLDALLSGTVLDPEVAYVLLKAPSGAVRAARWGEGTRGGVVERQFPVHARSARPAGAAAEPFGPVAQPDGPVVGTIAIGVGLASLAHQRRELVGRTVGALVISAVLAAALGHLLLTVLLRGALNRLLAGIRAIGAGQLDHRLRLDVRTAEVAEAARAFDEMAERLSESRAQVAARTEELTRALSQEAQAREAAAEKEERVRLLLESTAEAIYGLDLHGRCTFANPATARLLGYPAEALVGQDLHELIHRYRADGSPYPKGDCPVIAAVHDGREYHAAEVTYWRADGSSLAVESWCYPVRRRGETIGAVVTFLDVTERRRMEGELLNVKKLESLGVLAGGIAHDFNNLLTGVLGNLSLARERVPAGDETQEILEEAELAAKRARALTQQLLTFSKGGAPVKKVVSVRAVVDDAATFALRGSAVRGQVSSADDLWAIEADPGQLAQVVQNLVINALQAMPRGGTIALACENVELPAGGAAVPLAPGRYVRISVRDEGCGIAPEHLSRVFDPYFTTKQTGTGLGLATVYAIVKKHGGHVSVSSRLEVGTTVELWLPATGRPAGDEPAGAPAPPRGGGGRVLVMDDEELVRNAAGGMLASLGYEVLSAADGAEAVRIFEAERAADRPVDAVLMDLTVPGGMGGVEAVERLRRLDPSVRVVATSGYSNDPVMSAHGRFGFVGVLPKPYTLADLARAVGEAVTGGEPPARAQATSAAGGGSR